MISSHEVIFLPDDRKTEVTEGKSLLEAARLAGIDISSPCGGKGTCGKCTVIVLEGEQRTEALSCLTNVAQNMTVEIPDESRLANQKVLLLEKSFDESEFWQRYKRSPAAGKYFLDLVKPDLTDNMNDLDRLKTALKNTHGISADISIDCLRELPEVIRKGDFELTVTVSSYRGINEIIAAEPGKAEKPAYGAAVDIGTTTIAVSLLNLETGEAIDREGSYNKQATYGADVISRIIHADENKGGLEELKEAAADSINGLLKEMLQRNGLTQNDIAAVVCGGNTVMTHLFLGVPPTYLRLEPYIPAVVSFPPVKGRQTALFVHPDAPVLTIPSVASYVGGDITAGVFATLPDDSEEINLFIDVGTNGELVLGNSDWLVTCSCSAGPAFEGSGVGCGARAIRGAIDRIEISGDLKISYSVIGGGKPLGLCGSGLICLLSEMLDAGIIDRVGNIKDGNEPFLLVPKEDSATGGDIAIAESDIKNLLRAKAAVFAGIRSMLSQVQLSVSDISRVYIAGGFGSHINVTDAIRIGLLPDLPEDRYEYVGNSCVKGAALGLLSSEALRSMDDLAGRMTYIELSVGNQFMDEFVSALFIPHTDISLFPSLAGEKPGKE